MGYGAFACKVRKEFEIHRIQNNPRSVAILLYHKQNDSLLFVRQFRPPVYMSEVAARERQRLGNTKHEVSMDWKLGNDAIDTNRYRPGELGFTFELCAGIVDKEDLSLKEIAAEEIAEEVGYRVNADELQEITTIRSGVGLSGPKQVIYYATVDKDRKIGDGGGNVSRWFQTAVSLFYFPGFRR